MANDTVLLALNGEASLSEFSTAIGHFNALIKALTAETTGSTDVEWVVDTLQIGSVIVGAHGFAEDTGLVEKVVTGYAVVGQALATRTAIPYSEKVTKPARALTELLNGKIPSLRMETPTTESTVEINYNPDRPYKPSIAYGRLKGRIKTISLRSGIFMTLADALFDNAISCYLKAEQEDLAREYWGKKVFVSGKISRNPETGKPYSVKEVTNIEIFESKPGGFGRAKGVIELEDGQTSDSVIEKLRNE